MIAQDTDYCWRCGELRIEQRVYSVWRDGDVDIWRDGNGRPCSDAYWTRGLCDGWGGGCGDDDGGGEGHARGDPLPLCDDTLACAVRRAAR
mgnify:FL=1